MYRTEHLVRSNESIRSNCMPLRNSALLKWWNFTFEVKRFVFWIKLSINRVKPIIHLLFFQRNIIFPYFMGNRTSILIAHMDITPEFDTWKSGEVFVECFLVLLVRFLGNMLVCFACIRPFFCIELMMDINNRRRRRLFFKIIQFVAKISFFIFGPYNQSRESP